MVDEYKGDLKSEIVISVCTRGQVTIEWAVAYKLQTFPMNMPVRLFTTKGYNVSDSRALCIDFAKEHDAKYLIFYDDDVLPHDNMAILKLFYGILKNTDIDILSGVYPARMEGNPPVIFKEPNAGVDFTTWKNGGTYQVWMAGTGLCIMRMESILKLDVPKRMVGDKEIGDYFGSLERTDDVHLAEFCREQGLKWYVRGDVRADQIDLDGKVYELDVGDGQ